MPLQEEFANIYTQAEATKESLRKSIENIDQVIKSLINQWKQIKPHIHYYGKTNL